MYGVLSPDMTVDRRWLTEHPPPRNDENAEEADGGG
jgi:hypothetical protein